MNRVFNSRRAVIALTGIISILVLGLFLKLDVSMSIATIVMSICGANAIEKFSNKDLK